MPDSSERTPTKLLRSDTPMLDAPGDATDARTPSELVEGGTQMGEGFGSATTRTVGQLIRGGDKNATEKITGDRRSEFPFGVRDQERE